MVKHYEILYILPGNKTEEEAQAMAQATRSIIKQQGGEVVKEDFWGKRKLAYEINHLSHGYYDLVLFQIESTKLQALENILRLNENVVRHQITSFIVKSAEQLAAEERLRERIAARRQADKEKEVASAIVADNAPTAPVAEPVMAAPMDSAQLDKKLEEILDEDKLDV
jgi:small subunit ribosomal protein S6